MKTKKQIILDKFNNFNNKNSLICDGYYNLLADENLKSSHGVKSAKFPKGLGFEGEYELALQECGVEQVKGVTYFKQYFPTSGNTQHRLLIYAGDNKIYINQMFCCISNVNWLFQLQFNSAPLCLCFKKDDRDAMILTSVDKMVVWKVNYSPYTIENVPIITSMCMNEGVLFCTIKEPSHKIWYCTNLDVEAVGNIDANSNYISLNDNLGAAKKVVTFDEDVYVFREYGISKIKYIQNNITVSQVYASNTKIYYNTVSVCGSKIFFTTKEGIFTFNGTKVNKENINLENLLTAISDTAVASFMAGKYYLALKMDFNDNKQILCEQSDYINNAILIIDIDDFTYEIIRGVDVGSFMPILIDEFEKMLVTFNSGYTNKLGQITNEGICFENNLFKHYKTKEINLNNQIKMYTKLSVVSSCNVTFKFNFDGQSLSFTTYTSGLNEFNFKICAKSLNLEIESQDDVKIENLVLDYYDC